jgi:Sel1 repeat
LNLLKLLVMAVAIVVALPVQAQTTLDLDELLQMSWESTWGQSGAPLPVIKWTAPLKIRLEGDRAQARKAMVLEALDDMTGLAGLSYEVLTDPTQPANVTIEVVTQSPKATDSMPCVTSYQSGGTGMRGAQVVMRDSVLRYCLVHELGHLLGIPGHPMGRTVMTYFGGVHALTDYDKFLLRLRYSAIVPHGTSPLLFVRLAGEQFIRELIHPDEKMRAQQQLRAFLDRLNVEMIAYAKKEGEPPKVLYRAGRLNAEAVERGRITMQVFLGMSTLLGHLGPIDAPQAIEFFLLAARQGHVGAQFMLGLVYQTGGAAVRDLDLAHQWYACAARNGFAAASTALAGLEKALEVTTLLTMQAKTAQFLAQGGCLLQPPAS